MNLYQKYVSEMLKIIAHGVYYIVWHTAENDGDKRTATDAETIGKRIEEMHSSLQKAYQGADSEG